MQHGILTTQEEYHAALSRLEAVFMAKKGTPEYEEAEFLELLIKDYENKNFSFEAPNPIEAIKIRMEEKNLTPADLEGVIGSKSLISAVLKREKRLNIEMVRKLHKFLDIPTDILVQYYPLNNEKILT